jgi:hypothetical protein
MFRRNGAIFVIVIGNILVDRRRGRSNRPDNIRSSGAGR